MTNYLALEQQLTKTLNLTRRPVAVAFRDQPPACVSQFTGTQPSGCSFWKLAADGRAFYTVPSDHYNCSIGSYTHNIALPPGREQELPQTLSLMGELGYVSMDEVPGIPRLASTPEGHRLCAARRDAGRARRGDRRRCARQPDAAARGRHAQQGDGEADVGTADVHGDSSVGRRIAHEQLRLHRQPRLHGPVGGRVVFRDRGEEYEQIVNELGTIVSANAALRDYHQGRVASLRLVG